MAYSVGDPDHVPVHNDLVTEVQDLASAMSVEVVLPPVRAVGEGGHVDDHNLFTAAIQKIADEGVGGPVWAVASGGTESTYVGDGTNGELGVTYKVHKFTGNGTLTVSGEGLSDVLICGGGGAIGGSLESGGGGGVIEAQVYLTAGPHTVVRGAKGTPPANNSRLDDLVAVGGQNPQSRNPGGSGDGYGYADGFTAGQGYQGNSALKAGAGAGGSATTNAGGPGLPSYIDGTLKQYGHGGSSQDTGIVYTDPGAGESRSPTGAVGGTNGVVIIRYPIATP